MAIFAGVHLSAEIDADVQIGEGTKVWQFASIIRGARIGKNCTIGAGAIIDVSIVSDGCSIGAGAQIHPGVLLGDRVFVGPGAIFCNDAYPSVSKEGWSLQELQDSPAIVVEDGASIGAGAIILPGVRIGSCAMVAAGAVVRRDLPARALLHRDGTVQEVFHASHGNRMRFPS